MEEDASTESDSCELRSAHPHGHQALVANCKGAKIRTYLECTAIFCTGKIKKKEKKKQTNVYYQLLKKKFLKLNDILAPFLTSLEELKQNGLVVYDSSREEKFRVQVRLRFFTADAPARGEFLGLKQSFHPNVQCPCPWCRYFAGDAFEVDFEERSEEKIIQVARALEQMEPGPVSTLLSATEVKI